MTQPDPTQTFRQEAGELLEQLESVLLDLTHRPDDADLINSAFRALHTIKGSGAMFGFQSVADFVHEFETAFDHVRKGRTPASAALVAIALEARDHIAALIADPATPGGKQILESLRRLVTVEAPSVASGEESPGQPAAETTGLWRVTFRLPADVLLNGTNPLLMLDELRQIAPARVTALPAAIPALDAIDPEALYLGWQVDLEADDPRAAIDDVFLFVRDDMDLTVERLPVVAPAVAVAAPEIVPAADRSPQHTPTAPAGQPDRPAAPSLRVPAERLDELMDRVGELVIAQARLTQIAAHSADPGLIAIAEELERLSSGLRDTTMGIRMVPIGSLFSRFRRLVHDLSIELGKDISFETTGEDTELDKTVIEKLSDPLVHLIRNALDHGIEAQDRRLAAGKPAGGTVRLSATYAGAEVAVSVTDDGAGLDPARIRAKAEEAGLIAPDSRLTDVELYQLVFAPGFSTAREVTALSGRGVGMDVVKRTVEGLRGNIELTSTPGAGTTATLRLPLTLAIIDGMLVRVGSGRYVIPLAAVQECVELPDAFAALSSGRNFLDIRGSLVPFLRLRDVFETPTPPEAHQKVVIVSSGEGRVGLVVDQIVGNSQTVIKQLSKLHAGVRSFSGATILGDGTVALILDAAHLVTSGQSYVDQSRARLGRAA